MPSGERSQVWYPELVGILRTAWRADLSWDALIRLRDRLQAELEALRNRRGIEPPVIRCRCCGAVGPAKQPTISVRALLLAVGRFGIDSKDVVQRLERAWARHRAQNGLDLFGRCQQGRFADETRSRARDEADRQCASDASDDSRDAG